MSVTHHPRENLLASFAAGTLDEAEHLVVRMHVSGCQSCGRFVSAIEELAAVTLENAEPVPMAAGAFDAIMSRIHAHPAANLQAVPTSEKEHDPDIPKLLRRYQIGKRRRIAPGVSMRPIELRGAGKARAFLLQSAPGTRMLEHTHTGTEMTCVLKGSFSHQGGRYGPGDFDYGDDDINHRPLVGDEGPCLCLVAMTGKLQMNGFFGRLINPFVRL